MRWAEYVAPTKQDYILTFKFKWEKYHLGYLDLEGKLV